VKVAMQGTLQTPAVFDRQLKRMLADERSSALATRFGSQWLRLQDVEKVRPDHHFYSYWDHTLSEALVRETELFFDSLVREDRSVLDLLTADHTFVNERLARHYGIPNIIGNEFRRVTLADEHRRGILGQGSILLLTSIADRTSPVLRGKWVMEVLLGSPPPPPPPNVPALEETKAASDGKLLSTRERMEEHRKNPSCTSCHKVIDPLGLALENFDVTGVWRIKDNGVPIDPVGDLYDGTPDRPPHRAAQASGRHPAQLHREPDDLRARPPGRGLRHAGDSRDHSRCQAQQLLVFGADFRRGQEPGVPNEPRFPGRIDGGRSMKTEETRNKNEMCGNSRIHRVR
jgi:hypothetical protein